ncbi:MAG: HPF/RaiA family ribosome-associated protein [Pirellulales bacterium]|nr:HPF/RaiA family ribosome-associated protein [Pirellulales bacterium]
MKVHFIDRDMLLTDSLRELADRRLLFALSRFGARVLQVSMSMEVTPDSGTGFGLACRVHIQLRSAEPIVAHDEGADLEHSISIAAEKAGRAVSRSIRRLLDHSSGYHAKPNY